LRKRKQTVPYFKACGEWGNEENLKRGIQQGQAFKNSDGSVSWYEEAHDDFQGKRRDSDIKASKKVTAEQAQAITDSMDKLGWKSTSGHVGGPKLEILAGAKLPPKVLEQVDTVTT